MNNRSDDSNDVIRVDRPSDMSPERWAAVKQNIREHLDELVAQADGRALGRLWELS